MTDDAPRWDPGAAQEPAAPTQEPDGRRQRGDATREKVLDAAERCFAEEGFDAVSLRRIAAEAGVALSMVGFHGGAKRDLFVTVLKRRVEVLSAERLARLEALEAGTPDLEALCDAYVAPYLEIASTGDPQWRAYALLIARTATDDRWQGEVARLYDVAALRFIAAMERALLRQGMSVSRKGLAAGLTLGVAAMLSLVASRARIEGLGGDAAEKAPIAFRRVLVSFCAGGVAAAAAAKD